jgi:lysophospholipase L1-like esterase
MSTPYGLLLDEISALEPGALIVAQACLPRTDVYAAATLTWNAAMPAIVTAAQARGVNVIFDGTAAATVGITYTDGIHPDAAGYALVGAQLEPATRSWAGKAP